MLEFQVHDAGSSFRAKVEAREAAPTLQIKLHISKVVGPEAEVECMHVAYRWLYWIALVLRKYLVQIQSKQVPQVCQMTLYTAIDCSYLTPL